MIVVSRVWVCVCVCVRTRSLPKEENTDCQAAVLLSVVGVKWTAHPDQPSYLGNGSKYACALYDNGLTGPVV